MALIACEWTSLNQSGVHFVAIKGNLLSGQILTNLCVLYVYKGIGERKIVAREWRRQCSKQELLPH